MPSDLLQITVLDSLDSKTCCIALQTPQKNDVRLRISWTTRTTKKIQAPRSELVRQAANNILEATIGRENAFRRLTEWREAHNKLIINDDYFSHPVPTRRSTSPNNEFHKSTQLRNTTEQVNEAKSKSSTSPTSTAEESGGLGHHLEERAARNSVGLLTSEKRLQLSSLLMELWQEVIRRKRSLLWGLKSVYNVQFLLVDRAEGVILD